MNPRDPSTWPTGPGSFETTHLYCRFWSHPAPPSPFRFGFMMIEKCKHCYKTSIIHSFFTDPPSIPNTLVESARSHERDSPCSCGYDSTWVSSLPSQTSLLLFNLSGCNILWHLVIHFSSLKPPLLLHLHILTRLAFLFLATQSLPPPSPNLESPTL